ncbi:MAG: DUF3417 domain-containing protein, partial [Acidimicrobiales bacterium]
TAQRDHIEANSLFDILENQILPAYYDQRGGRFPRHWVRRIRASLRSLGPQVLASRMVKDYVDRMYEPTAARTDALSESGHARARSLAAWKQRVSAAWDDVVVEHVDGSTDPLADLGDVRPVSATVSLGQLGPEDVAVEVLYGRVGSGDELSGTEVLRLDLLGPAEGSGRYRYEGSFVSNAAGRMGYTVRVVPAHPDLAVAAEMGCVAWG